tara:strand:- start:3471 stop:4421 length:951 start_codon:yes stop_codon:yes gene_type:complete
MDQIMSGNCPAAQIAGLLCALRLRGESAAELAGMAASMRAHMVPVSSSRGPLIDTCGTGGDGSNTINISTAAAMIAAAGGAVVAKHGNRSISSKCGSADVLEALGVPINLEIEALERCLEDSGIAFLFAPQHHPAMRHVMPVRRELATRTAFNLLGPMTNPAGARRQVIGVFSPVHAETLAHALLQLGGEHVLVFCGDDGRGKVLDELSICGTTRVWEVKDNVVESYSLEPEELGLRRCEITALRGGDAAQNAAAIESLLGGEPGPRADAVAANAGAALYIAGLAPSLRAGVDRASSLLQQGAGLKSLQALREFEA